MHLSVEISMYPLQANYKELIKEFLVEINKADTIEIRTSNMSTRLFGEYDELTTLLNSAMRQSMQKHGKMVFVCKYLQGDARELRGYE